ncbi:MAG: FG-GAP-like repeat-containing protein, partial [Bacteroidota bacterium]
MSNQVEPEVVDALREAVQAAYPGLYKNQSVEGEKSNWLQIELKGAKGNPNGRGARVFVHGNGSLQYQENTVERGYLSAVSGVLHFGLGKEKVVDKIEVMWPNGKMEMRENVQAGQRLVFRQTDANARWPQPEAPAPMFVPRNAELNLAHRHRENTYNDFKSQVLLPHKMSRFGPGLAVADVNGDGLEDLFVGGARDQAGTLYLRQKWGAAQQGTRYEAADIPAFTADRAQEDLGALFFDADGDSDLDLYVVSGGAAFPANAPQYQDRLYLNDGRGAFSKSTGRIPEIRASGSCVVAGDMDADGDLDLFVGGRHIPGRYPEPPRSFLLRNDSGIFTDVTAEVHADLPHIGMVTAALWTDFDNDQKLDLIVVGEWMAPTVFLNEGGTFRNHTADYFTD